MRAVDIFPWNDRFNTGLPEIDAQHRVLVGLLNELAGHIVSVTDFPDLNRILAELADYTVYHFASEDALWNRYITDEHERSVHRHWHENFTSTIARLRDEQSARPLAEVVDETVAFLARWLISHILQQDRYCAHVVTGMQQGMAPDAARADAAERMKGSSGLLTELLLSTYGALAANTVSLMRENTERKRVQASLHESEERFRTIVEQSPVGIILHRDGHVIQVNEAAVRMFRYRSLDDMLGTVVFDNIAPENRAEVQDLAHRRLRGEDAELMYETVGLRRDGSRFPLVLAPRRMQTAEGPVIGAFLLDITERKRAEEVERTVSRTIKLLSRTNALLVRVPDEQALLDGACRMAVEVGGYLMAWVGYARDDAAKSVAPVAHYGYEAHYLEEAQLSWGDNAQGQGPTGRAIRTGRRMVSQDIEHSPEMTPWRRAALLRGYKGTVSLPLPVDGKVVGALVIYSASTAAFGAAEVTLREALAHDLAFGIQALQPLLGIHRAQGQIGAVLEVGLGRVVARGVHHADGAEQAPAQEVAREVLLRDARVAALPPLAELMEVCEHEAEDGLEAQPGQQAVEREVGSALVEGVESLPEVTGELTRRPRGAVRPGGPAEVRPGPGVLREHRLRCLGGRQPVSEVRLHPADPRLVRLGVQPEAAC